MAGHGDRPGGAPSPDAPEEVARLAAQRETHRLARDFVAADELRERIRRHGFEVTDTPDGPVLSPVPPTRPARRLRPDEVAPVPAGTVTHEASVLWLVQGWPQDVLRGLEGFARHHPGRALQHVVVDASGADPDTWPPGCDVVPLDRDPGFGLGRNLGLRRATAPIVVVVDGSVEPTGDVLAPLEEALADPSVGVAGPIGVVTEDLHEFHESTGPVVDAVEAYLMAFRREVLHAAGGFDERFRFYRSADIELSFRVKALGLRAVVVPVPMARHEHRMWSSTPPDRREQLSKRNFYRFLDKWRGRLDLCVGRGGADLPG